MSALLDPKLDWPPGVYMTTDNGRTWQCLGGVIGDSATPPKLNRIPENTAKYRDSEQTGDSNAP